MKCKYCERQIKKTWETKTGCRWCDTVYNLKKNIKNEDGKNITIILVKNKKGGFKVLTVKV